MPSVSPSRSRSGSPSRRSRTPEAIIEVLRHPKPLKGQQLEDLTSRLSVPDDRPELLDLPGPYAFGEIGESRKIPYVFRTGPRFAPLEPPPQDRVEIHWEAIESKTPAARISSGERWQEASGGYRHLAYDTTRAMQYLDNRAFAATFSSNERNLDGNARKKETHSPNRRSTTTSPTSGSGGGGDDRGDGSKTLSRSRRSPSPVEENPRRDPLAIGNAPIKGGTFPGGNRDTAEYLIRHSAAPGKIYEVTYKAVEPTSSSGRFSTEPRTAVTSASREARINEIREKRLAAIPSAAGIGSTSAPSSSATGGLPGTPVGPNSGSGSIGGSRPTSPSQHAHPDASKPQKPVDMLLSTVPRQPRVVFSQSPSVFSFPFPFSELNFWNSRSMRTEFCLSKAAAGNYKKKHRSVPAVLLEDEARKKQEEADRLSRMERNSRSTSAGMHRGNSSVASRSPSPSKRDRTEKDKDGREGGGHGDMVNSLTVSSTKQDPESRKQQRQERAASAAMKRMMQCRASPNPWDAPFCSRQLSASANSTPFSMSPSPSANGAGGGDGGEATGGAASAALLLERPPSMIHLVRGVTTAEHPERPFGVESVERYDRPSSTDVFVTSRALEIMEARPRSALGISHSVPLALVADTILDQAKREAEHSSAHRPATATSVARTNGQSNTPSVLLSAESTVKNNNRPDVDASNQRPVVDEMRQDVRAFTQQAFTSAWHEQGFSSMAHAANALLTAAKSRPQSGSPSAERPTSVPTRTPPMQKVVTAVATRLYGQQHTKTADIDNDLNPGGNDDGLPPPAEDRFQHAPKYPQQFRKQVMRYEPAAAPIPGGQRVTSARQRLGLPGKSSKAAPRLWEKSDSIVSK